MLNLLLTEEKINDDGHMMAVYDHNGALARGGMVEVCVRVHTCDHDVLGSALVCDHICGVPARGDEVADGILACDHNDLLRDASPTAGQRHLAAT